MLLLNFYANEIALPTPCRRSDANGSTMDITAAFHPAYLVNTFEQGFLGKSIELVVNTRTPQVKINPPLFYKKTRRRQKDVSVALGIRSLELLTNAATAFKRDTTR